MSSRPKISVLLPTYNYARFLPEAIASILAQDFSDYELIISDDASNDGSDAVLRRYASRDARLRVEIQPKNIGMVANWNHCLKAASGEYVKFLFGDDLLPDPTALSRLSMLLDKNPTATLAASARLVVDDRSNTTGILNELHTEGLYNGPALIRRCLLQDRNLIGEPSAVLFRREAGHRGFDPRWNQLVDLEFWLNLLASGDLAYDPQPLCAFRVHSTQQSVINSRANVGPAERLNLFARYAKFFFTGPAGSASSADERRALFRCLYYSRRYARRSKENGEVEATLRWRLAKGWYALYWFRHRITKPFLNFGNRLSTRDRQELTLQGNAKRARPLPPRSFLG